MSGVQFSMRVDGSELKSVLGAIQLASDEITGPVVRDAMNQGMEYTRTYPPELPNQRYRRTGRYFRSFKVIGSGRKFTITTDAVRNGVHYSPFVGGRADGTGQAAIHADRWTRVRTAMLWVASLVAERARDLFNRAATGHFGL